jgi:hypothetical protein
MLVLFFPQWGYPDLKTGPGDNIKRPLRFLMEFLDEHY